jgi:hypothetical protein
MHADVIVGVVHQNYSTVFKTELCQQPEAILPPLTTASKFSNNFQNTEVTFTTFTPASHFLVFGERTNLDYTLTKPHLSRGNENCRIFWQTLKVSHVFCRASCITVEAITKIATFISVNRYPARHV